MNDDCDVDDTWGGLEIGDRVRVVARVDDLAEAELGAEGRLTGEDDGMLVLALDGGGEVSVWREEVVLVAQCGAAAGWPGASWCGGLATEAAEPAR